MLRAMKLVLFLGLIGLIGLAQATGISYQAVSNGVAVTFLGVDSPDGPPPVGAYHCLTGTRSRWASTDGGRTFGIGQMIGGCGVPDSRGNITHTVHRDAAFRNGVLCIIPIFVDRGGRLLAWSSHPDGETQGTARSGGMITALTQSPDGSWRAATAAEAYTCD